MIPIRRRWTAGVALVATAAATVLVGAPPAHAADTFQCGATATGFASDVDGVLWRYAFTNPGRSNALHQPRVKVGNSGWQAYGRVLGGRDGRVYGINSSGMYRYRWNGTSWDTVDGSQRLLISTSFASYATAAYRNKITIDENGDFFVIDSSGRLRWHRYDEASRTWTISGRVLDTGWDRYDLIVAGGPGVLFARTPSGLLHRHRFEPVSQRWITQNALVGTSGWQTFTKGLFSVGGDTLYGIEADGDILHYRYREDDNTWPVHRLDIGNNWQQYPNVLAVTDTCRLTDRHVPARPSTPLLPYSPTAVAQARPTGTAVSPIEYLHADNIGRLRHAYQANPDDTGSVQWTTVPGDEAFTGKPALVANAQERLQALAHSTNSDVWSFTRSAAPATDWQAGLGLGGAMRSAPALVRLSDSTLAAFALDGSGALWFRSQDGSAGDLLPWRSLGGSGMTGDPFVIAGTDRSAILIIADANGTLRTATFRDGVLSAWTSLGGSGFTGSPAVVVMPGRLLRVFARAADGQIVTQRQDVTGAFPGAWDPVGSFQAAGPPAAILDPVLGQVAVVVRGSDNEIYRVFETAPGSNAWGDWIRVNETSDPAATDPTVTEYTGAGGQSWLIVFRNVNDVTRVYDRRLVNPATTGMAGRVASGSRIPTFVRHTIPAPPR